MQSARKPPLLLPVLFRAASLFIPFALLIALLVAHSHNRQRELIESIELSKAQGAIENYKQYLGDHLAVGAKDLTLLANSPQMRSYANLPTTMHERALADLFISFSRAKGIYDQIRLLNMDGREVVRVNHYGGAPAPVQQSALQDKSSRPYFLKTKSLPPNSFHLSPIELNMEEGKVEYPLKPTLRIATPITDSSGEKLGVLVLNYLAAHILHPESVIRGTPSPASRVTITDGYGFWIKAEHPGEAWGTQLSSRKSFTFQARHPQAWETIVAKHSGEARTDEGLFVYQSIELSDMLEGRLHTTAVASRSQTLRLIAFAPREELEAVIAETRTASLIAGAVSLLIVAVLALWLAMGMHRRKEIERRLEEQNAKLGRTLDDLQIAYEEQESSKRELTELGLRLQGVLDAASEVGVMAFGADGIVTLFNTGAERLLGNKASEAVGALNMLSLFRDEEIQRRGKELSAMGNRAVEGIEVLTLVPSRAGHETRTWTLTRKDGTQITTSLTITAIHDNEGEMTGFLGVARDVTVENLAQKRLEAVLKAAPDAIVTLDSEGIIVKANAMAGEMFRAPEKELAGRYVGELLPPPYDTLMAPMLYSPEAGAQGMQAREIPGRRRDGSVFPLEASVGEVRLEGTSLFIAMLRDISRRKKAEETLIKTKTLLERKQAALDDELRAAARMQTNLMPKASPSMDGASAAWRYEPSLHVGGDVFSLELLDADHLAAFMIDVSGHGLASALVGATVTQALRPGAGFLTRAGYDTEFIAPHETLRLLDREFPMERFENFFSMVHCILHLDSGELAYASGGHPPALVLRKADGTVEALEKSGPVVGIGGNAAFPPGEARLFPGDLLLLYTDGCTEHQDAHKYPYGQEGLSASLAQCRDLPLDDALESLWEDLKSHGGRLIPEDDLTMLLIRYDGRNS